MTACASPSEIERLVYYMPTIARLTENHWTKGFAQSVIRQAKRRNWKPSAKQIGVMQSLVSELFTGSIEMDLIDGGDA